MLRTAKVRLTRCLLLSFLLHRPCHLVKVFTQTACWQLFSHNLNSVTVTRVANSPWCKPDAELSPSQVSQHWGWSWYKLSSSRHVAGYMAWTLHNGPLPFLDCWVAFKGTRDFWCIRIVAGMMVWITVASWWWLVQSCRGQDDGFLWHQTDERFLMPEPWESLVPGNGVEMVTVFCGITAGRVWRRFARAKW